MSFYSTFYRQIAWPGYELLRGRHTCRLLKAAQERQWWSAATLREFQEREFGQLLAHAKAHSPWHRDRLPDPGDFRSLADLRRLPITNRETVRQHREAMVAATHRDRVFPHRTGGSTGVPLTVYLTRETYEWRNAMTLRGYGWAGAQPGMKTYYLWSVPVQQQAARLRLKEHLDHALARQTFFNNFRLSKDTLPACLDALNRCAPHVLIGYTSMLEYLARHIRNHGGLRVRLHSVITAAEGVNAAQRELLQEVFECPVFASYGCREFKLIAMECEHGGLHVSADNLIVECVPLPSHVAASAQRVDSADVAASAQRVDSPPPARVLITDLHNYGMPLIRYELGDLATTRLGDCRCGRGLPMLETVHGRIPDTIQTPDGKLISGIFFPHLLKEFGWIEEFQVVQRELDKVLVKLVTEDQRAAEQGLPEMRRAVLDVLGDQITLTTEFVDEIPRTATGKLRPVISEIPVVI